MDPNDKYAKALEEAQKQGVVFITGANLVVNWPLYLREHYSMSRRAYDFIQLLIDLNILSENPENNYAIAGACTSTYWTFNTRYSASPLYFTRFEDALVFAKARFVRCAGLADYKWEIRQFGRVWKDDDPGI